MPGITIGGGNSGSLTLQATTGDTGYTLVNGTGVILSWTAPNDGNLHTVHVIVGLHVTNGQTGGAIALNTTLPDGATVTPNIFAGGAGIMASDQSADKIVQPGSTTTLTQSSAMSAGAATLWAEIWGA
jgi:hypothetical protein